MDSRLLVHAGPDLPERAGWLASRAWWRPAAPVPMQAIVVRDLQGTEFFSTAVRSAVCELRLPAGTYHVTVQQGPRNCRYTVSLSPGAEVHLWLPRAA